MTDGSTMKAVAAHRYGPPETLSLRDVPIHRPTDGEIRVRVHATTVNRTDIATRLGPFEPA